MRASGFRQARRKSAARKASIDPNAAAGIRETVEEVHLEGRKNIDAMTDKRTGRLRRWYKKALRKGGSVGLVGYVSRKARSAAYYARFVHDGTSKTKARPFHDQAVNSEAGNHAKRMRRANADALLGRASPSGLARTGGQSERDVE